MGRPDPLLSELPGWQRLGASEAGRQARWREWVHTPLTERELAAVRRAVVTGRRFGSAGSVETTGRQLGLPFERRPRGRPRKGQQPEN